MFLSCYFHCSRHHRDLHSFPTRRSSDLEHARELAKVLQGIPAKINLIPFNPFNGSDYRCSSKEVIDNFRLILMRSGLVTVTRKTRGDDIDAACGQLVGKVVDRTKKNRSQTVNFIQE
mgnify:CR=1 FL=1